MRVDFYHLRISSLENVLPVLAEKVFSGGNRLLIKLSEEAQADHINSLLWTFKADSWLPHGMVKDGHVAQQPVLISLDGQNLNNADMLMLVDYASADDLAGYKRCFFIFDGHNNTVVEKARLFWKSVVSIPGNEAHYWAQNEEGKWEEKAYLKSAETSV